MCAQKRLEWGSASIPVCPGKFPERPQEEQFGETLKGPATAWQAAKWPAALWLQCLEGLPSTFREVTGTLSPLVQLNGLIMLCLILLNANHIM